jgi:hypothetical protein
MPCKWKLKVGSSLPNRGRDCVASSSSVEILHRLGAGRVASLTFIRSHYSMINQTRRKLSQASPARSPQTSRQAASRSTQSVQKAWQEVSGYVQGYFRVSIRTKQRDLFSVPTVLICENKY